MQPGSEQSRIDPIELGLRHLVDREATLVVRGLGDPEVGLKAAATLADRYIQDRFLPDKAIDLIDEAGARLRLSILSSPPELREFAGLARHAMLIGQGNRLELWDEARWMERRDYWLKSEETATDLSTELDSLSL